MVTRLRMACIPSSLTPLISSPSTRIEPTCGFRKPIKIRRATDFPTPLLPRMHSVSPRWTLKLTLSRTLRSPNHIETWLNEIIDREDESSDSSIPFGLSPTMSARTSPAISGISWRISGLRDGSDVAMRSAYPKRSGNESLGARQILPAVHVQKPESRRQSAGMTEMAGLNEYFNRKNRDGLSQAVGGEFETRKASATAFLEMRLEKGKSHSVNHCRKGLRETVH